MSILSFFNRPKKAEPKSYKFSTLDGNFVGDKYVYTVEASSREEAFEKLVRYFYERGFTSRDDVKSEHFHVTIPAYDRFDVYGMPLWFARKISGRGNSKEFMDYVEKHNIKVEH